MVISCLSTRTIENYLRGESSDIDVDTLETHIASCKSCQQLLEKVADDGDSDLQWIACAQPEKLQVGARAGASRLFHPTDDRFAQPPASGLGSEVDRTMVTIRDYRIIEQIGQGGMGTVYRALHLRLNRVVALKILKSDRLESLEANSRFTREMRLLAQLEHPRIVRALDAGEFEGQQYFVMEFIPGIDLGHFIRRLGPLPVVEACEVIRQAAGALHYAHERKILHRDVKPSNLMITADGNVKLLDLGLAQLLDKGESSVTEADQAVGTFAYMAPETLYGKATASPQSDVYSLGVTLFQMLTGMRPFERPGMPVLIPDLISMRPDVPPALNALVYRMIAVEASERPRSMQEVESFFSHLAVNADVPSLVAEYYRWGNRSGQHALSRHSNPVPPPVQATLSGPLKSPRWSRSLVAIGVIGLLAALSGYGGQWWKDPISSQVTANIPREEKLPVNPESPPQPIRPAEGTLKVLAHGGVASQLRDEGRISLIDVETNQRYTLDDAELQLPASKYAISFDSPVALSEEGQVVEVSSSTSTLNIRATLTSPFQFPTLPTVAGGYASYYGSIWHDGWSKGEATTFELSLEMLAGPEVRGINRTRWMRIVANLPKEDYCETAYVQIDESRWLVEHRIEIIEGLVQPTGRSITRFCESLAKDDESDARWDALVLPLDAQSDHIAAIAGLDLPEKRISTQDFLTLFFGAGNLTAASEHIRSLRAGLASPGGRNAWLADIDNGTGPVSCYVVSSRQQTDKLDSFGYSMARRDAELFGFVQLEVNTPSMVASCILKDQTPQPRDGAIHYQLELDRFRGQLVHPRELPPSSGSSNSSGSSSSSGSPGSSGSTGIGSADSGPSKHWTQRPDLATIPARPSSVAWRGSIATGNRMEVIEVNVSMLWRGEIDGRDCQWLELDVESTSEGRVHWEGARVLIDCQAYEARHKFKILRGWVAFDKAENVFPFPLDGDLDNLLVSRLQRQLPTAFDRIGVVDVLGMLFDADLKPKTTIGTLRPMIAGMLSGAERQWVAEERNTKLGRVSGVLWKPPAGAAVQYEFFRSADVPFGFVAVSLKVPLLIDIGLEADSCDPIENAATNSLFGSAEALEKAVIHNQKLIAANELPNWRVWSWTHNSVEYKVWAEYAGEIGASNTASRPQFVLLANSAGKIIRVPYSDLSPADRAFSDEGRVWASGPKTHIKQKLLQDNERTGILSLTHKWRSNSNLTTGYYELATMISSDRDWVYRLRAIKRQPLTLDQAVNQWKDIVSYSRP